MSLLCRKDDRTSLCLSSLCWSKQTVHLTCVGPLPWGIRKSQLELQKFLPKGMVLVGLWRLSSSYSICILGCLGRTSIFCGLVLRSLTGVLLSCLCFRLSFFWALKQSTLFRTSCCGILTLKYLVHKAGVLISDTWCTYLSSSTVAVEDFGGALYM